MLKDFPDGEVLLIKAFKKPAGSDLTILQHLPTTREEIIHWEVPDSQVKINGFLLKVSLDLADESRL